MSNNTQVAPATCSTRDALKKAVDAAFLGHSCVRDLGTLFEAIRDASEEGSQARKLARIGTYLAEDWCNSLEADRDNLEEMLEAQS